MGGQGWPVITPMMLGGNNGTTAATATTETSLFPSLAGTKTVPAGWFQPGYACRINLRGTVTTTLIPGTVTIRIKLNGTTIATTTMGSLLGSLSAQFFQVICNLQALTVGTNGTLAIGGAVTYPTGLAGLQAGNSVLNATGVPFDTTVAQTIDVTCQHTVTGNSVQTTIATIELIPQQPL